MKIRLDRFDKLIFYNRRIYILFGFFGLKYRTVFFTLCCYGVILNIVYSYLSGYVVIIIGRFLDFVII